MKKVLVVYNGNREGLEDYSRAKQFLLDYMITRNKIG